MTNRILTRLAFALAVPVLAAGCIEEAFPDNGTFTDDQLDEYSVELLLNGLPADLMSSNTAGYYSSYGDQTDFGYPSICLRTDYMLADIVSLGTPNYNQFNYYIGCLSMGPDYQYCGYYWDTYYAWIKEANEIISRIDHNTEDQQEREWLAQAYTYRAMFYLDLARLYIPKENNYVRVYANIRNLTVPIVTENTTEAMAQNNPRATREDMYDFILGDLDAAVTYFGNSASTGYTRRSKWGPMRICEKACSRAFSMNTKRLFSRFYAPQALSCCSLCILKSCLKNALVRSKISRKRSPSRKKGSSFWSAIRPSANFQA